MLPEREGKEVSLLGAVVEEKSGPVEPFWMNLEPGIAVVYGKNGSGKSHVLRRLASVGQEPRSYLHFQSFPPSKEQPGEISIWRTLNLEHQEQRPGFHEHALNTLPSNERLRFGAQVHETFVIWLIEVLKDDLDISIHEIINLLESHLEELRAPQVSGKAIPSEYSLPLNLCHYSQIIQLLAYKCEIWIHDDEDLFGLLVYSIAREVLHSAHFVVSAGKLHVWAEMPDSGFGVLYESLDHSEQEWDYLLFTGEFGRLGESFDSWTAEKEDHINPWRGLLIDTDVQDPPWGEVFSDVDLDQKHYGLDIDAYYLASCVEFFRDQRARLETDDPRYQSYWDSEGNQSLVMASSLGTRWDEITLETLQDSAIRANLLFQDLLESEVHLTCVPTPLVAWGERPALMWEAHTKDGSVIPLSKLSWAEQRWASFAIKMSTPSVSAPVRILIIDEPERGLHRRAERQLAHSLQRYIQDSSLTCVLATHSPTFLGLKNARLHHLWKGPDGVSHLEALPSNIEPWIAVLGLEKHDLLQLCKLFLIVEGEHDAIILNKLFEDEFHASGVKAVPLRGLRNLANATDASFIFRFTEASVIYLSDNENSAEISAIWSEAQKTPSQERIEVLDKLTKNRKSAEAQFLKEYMMLAADFAASERILFKALPAPDILDYLPVNHFVKEATSWQDLREKWLRSGNKNFKNWLSLNYKADFSSNNVLRALDSMDSIPKDPTDLLAEVLNTVR